MKKQFALLVMASLLLIGCGKHNNSQGTSSGGNSGDPTSGGTDTSSEPAGDNTYDYNGYYANLSWTDGEDLKQKLYTIMRNGYKPLKFEGPNWESNTVADHVKDDFGYVDVVYSKTDIDATKTQRLWQREHAFAASLMTGTVTSNAVKFLGRATDFHNLFAGEASANGSRQNKNYGVAGSGTDRTTDGGNDGYKFDTKNFEPGNKDKGRLARAIFYMATMYKDDEQDTVNNVLMKGLTIQEEYVDYVAGNNCAFAIGNLSALLSWNANYDVDYLEMQHNESVYSHVYQYSGSDPEPHAQGNRNAFVDFPNLVDYVYGSKKNKGGSLADLVPSAIKLETNKDEFSHYAIKTATREFSYGDTLTTADYSLVSVKKNFVVEDYTGASTNSLANYTFVESDGESKQATITVGEQQIKYVISLDPIGKCSYSAVDVKKGSISNSYDMIGVNQNITYNEKNFVFNATIDEYADHTKKWTLTDRTSGGFNIGSGTYIASRISFTTVDSVTVDEVYFKGIAYNSSSSYTLTIKVGETVAYSGTVPYVNATFKTFGKHLTSPLTGQVSYIFEGSNSMHFYAFAFNEVI